MQSFHSMCFNDLEYMFWENFHLIQSVYRKVIADVIAKYLDKFLRATLSKVIT